MNKWIKWRILAKLEKYYQYCNKIVKKMIFFLMKIRHFGEIFFWNFHPYPEKSKRFTIKWNSLLFSCLLFKLRSASNPKSIWIWTINFLSFIFWFYLICSKLKNKATKLLWSVCERKNSKFHYFSSEFIPKYPHYTHTTFYIQHTPTLLVRLNKISSCHHVIFCSLFGFLNYWREMDVE